MKAKNSAVYRLRSRLWKSFKRGKPAIQAAMGWKVRAQLFIFGCQRSGTTHLEHLFQADPRSTVFSEFGDLSIAKGSTVWRPIADVRKILLKQRGIYTIARSLLFSHRAIEALDELPQSAAIWIFRDVNCVVDSMIRKWGRDFQSVSKKVESDSQGNWALQKLWRDICDEVVEIHNNQTALESDQGVRDAYALYWYYRNKSFFDSGLNGDPRVVVVEYEDVLSNPKNVVNSLLKKQSIKPSQISFPLRTNALSSRNQRVGSFTAKIELKCEELYKQLSRARNL